MSDYFERSQNINKGKAIFDLAIHGFFTVMWGIYAFTKQNECYTVTEKKVPVSADFEGAVSVTYWY